MYTNQNILNEEESAAEEGQKAIEAIYSDKVIPASLPVSCTSLPINIVGLVSFIAALYWLQYLSLSSIAATIIALLAFAVPILILEVGSLKTYQRTSTGLDFTLQRSMNWQRIAVKLLGISFTLSFIGAIYWLIPEYHKTFYHPYWEMLGWTLPYALTVAAIYVFLVDRFQKEPEDVYWQLGKLVLGRSSALRRNDIYQHLLGWLVKGFFLPLMFVYTVHTVDYIRRTDFSIVLSSFQHTYEYLWQWIFLIDLTVATIGYVLTLRLLDNHIRSTDSTVGGWAVALICYEPFWTFVYGAYFSYNNDNFNWGNWLYNSPVLYVIWGSLILLSITIYVLSHLTFGLRFSNLTHRGILTNGLYRFCKHPAYVSKNIAWWLVTVPFISTQGWQDAVHNCLMLSVVNLIYFTRAKTEERHLSRDPVYVQYALLMNNKSVFRVFSRIIPYLRYRPPMEMGTSIN